jgi:thiamine-phosphate pyrophosphorylase
MALALQEDAPLLYLCTDRRLAGGRPLVSLVEAAVLGGVGMVQLREKDLGGGEFFALARELRDLTRRFGVPLIINDRLDIALASGADGVHLGQDDLPLREARRVAGPDLIIGVSAHSPAEAVAAERDGADYLGCGAVYPTGTKADIRGVIGLEGLAAVCAAVRIPVIGIGGIGPANAAAVIRAGAAGLAVISSILSQEDAREAAALLRRSMRTSQE